MPTVSDHGAVPDTIAVATSYQFPGKTGSPILSMQASRALADEGADVYVLRYGGWRGRRQTARWGTIDIHTLPLASLIPLLTVLARKRRPQVVHAHGLLGAKFGAILAALSGAALVVELHEVTPMTDRAQHSASRQLHALADRLVRRRIDGVIVLSERQRAQLPLAGYGPGLPSLVLYPPVDREFFAATSLGPTTSNPRIGYAGNFMPWQGVDLLIAAMDKVWSEHPDAELALWGVEEDQASGWRDRLANARGPWTLHGRVELDQMPDVLRSLDILVIPRPDMPQNSTTSRKLGEYLASGRPTVVTDVADHRELLTPTDAALVVGTDPSSIADGLLEVLTRPDEAAARAARGLEVARSRFDLDAATEQRLLLFRAAIDRRGQRRERAKKR